jgi:hypothetical protein
MGLAACGGDSKPSASESAFCDGLVSFDKISTPGGPDEDPVAANKTFGAAASGPSKTLVDNVPSDIKADVDKLDAAVKKSAGGDAAGGDAVGDAKGPIEKWAYDNCDFHTISITAADYSYTGMPKTLKAGKTAITFKNEGKETHIMLWLERKAGDTRPAPEAINAAFANKFEGMIDADPAGAGPGQTGGITMDIPAGKYTVFCPIGVKGNEDDSHFMHGMATDVTVS